MKYSIYQIKDIENCDYAFRRYDEDKFDFLDYGKVYSDDIETYPNPEPIEVLEDIYEMFNVRHPEDFKGHSLSVSDVVCIDMGSPIYYYCNSVGWKELPLEIILK